MYELFLFTFPFFRILVSFVHSLYLSLSLSALFPLTLAAVLVFCLLLDGLLFFYPYLSFIIFLRSIASHLIHLNSFSIVFMIARYAFSRLLQFTVALPPFAHFITDALFLPAPARQSTPSNPPSESYLVSFMYAIW